MIDDLGPPGRQRKPGALSPEHLAIARAQLGAAAIGARPVTRGSTTPPSPPPPERARAREGLSDEQLAALQRQAAQRARTCLPDCRPEQPSRGVAEALPARLQAASGVRVVNPKIWNSDAHPIRGARPDFDAWLSRARAAIRGRGRGDVLAVTADRIAGLLVYCARRTGDGFARVTFADLAKLAGCCVETARRAVRCLEGWGVVDTFNVLVRRPGGAVERDANLYLLRDSAQDSAERESPPADRLADRLSRYAAVFGLRARLWGLNATPLRSPAPARTPAPSTA